MKYAWMVFQNTLILAFAAMILAGSSLTPIPSTEGARAYTRILEFDYVNWTADALLMKIEQSSISVPRYLTPTEQHDTVIRYIELVRQIDDAEYQVELIYADPKINDKDTALKPWQEKLASLRELRSVLGPVAEEIFQKQVSDILNAEGLGVGGQPLPPVLYHVTPLPYALIISPRNEIKEVDNISLDPNLTLDQMVTLENQVEKETNVSALVTPIGGIGIYPTMVMSTSDLSWLGEVVAHEWTHNYLTIRPLGFNYFANGQLRTMNETTANIVGKEIGKELLKQFYPEYLPKEPEPTPVPTSQNKSTPTPTPGPPQFNFNKEMHLTRVTVDEMLKDGKIDEAEAYMEARRKVFWDHGYLIRKLNQAYFAFNGAYADVPGGGAAGSDPIGPAVVALRNKSASLLDFLNRISTMTSFAQLQKAVQ